jgi:O-antigen/teichoic acid export membrane protein
LANHSSALRRIGHGAFWTSAGTVAGRLLGLATSIIIARMLGSHRFGEYAIVQGTVGACSVFAGFGLGVTATKHVAEFRRSDPARAGAVIALSRAVALFCGLSMAAALYFFAPWLAANTLAAPHLSGALRVGAALLLLGSVNGAQTGALVGFEAFGSVAVLTAISSVLNLVCVYSGGRIYGLSGAVWGLVIAMLLTCVAFEACIRRIARQNAVSIALNRKRAGLNILWSSSVPSTIGGLFIGPLGWAASAILVNQPHGYNQLALYNVANQWRMAILFLPAALGAAAMPVLASLSGEKGGRAYKILWGQAMVGLFLGLGVALPIVLLSKPIMRSYGSDFAVGWPVLSILACSASVLTFNNQVSKGIAGLGKMWASCWSDLSFGVTFFLVSLLAAPRFGALGLGLAQLIAASAQALVLLRYLRYLRPVEMPDGGILKLLWSARSIVFAGSKLRTTLRTKRALFAAD